MTMNKYLITIIAFVAIIASAFSISSKKTSIPEPITSETVYSTTTSQVKQQETTTETPTQKPTQTTTKTTPTPTPEPAPVVTVKSFTAAEVSLHSDSSSCWTTINGNVYDVTSYISRHPGGERNILRICGSDGSSLFEGQHGGDSKPERILASFNIGILK